VNIIFKAGNGGTGAAGGQFGGPGGIGGDIILKGSNDLSMDQFSNILKNERTRSFDEIDASLVKDMSNSVLYNTIRAESGTHCKAKDRWGKNGKSIVLNVPTGIRIRDSDTGKIIAEVDHHNQEIIIARGGIGGRGLRGPGLNSQFRKFTNQEEKIDVMKKLRGEPGEYLKTSLELKKIADVAFIGYPNAGKSTLLNGLSNMNVTISAEPFTTLKPNVAHLVFKNKKIKIADLPGLIDGSHQGKGCGDLFLSMVERNDSFVLVVDINGFQLNATSPHSQQSKYSTY